jgi:transcriptional repressor NrdR
MLCPFCNSFESEVINSRPTNKNKETWRRRRCTECKHIFTTYEKLSLDYLHVKKRKSPPEVYSYAKLYSGIYAASLQKKNRDRGDMAKFCTTVVNEVESQIILRKYKTISTKQLKDLVVSVLMKKDKSILLSYIAYFNGSVYMSDFKPA